MDARIPFGFPSGTLIATEHGEEPVDWLASGVRVETLELGYQPIAWVGRMTVPPDGLTLVEIPPDTFGPGQPVTPLWLDPSHKIVVSGALVELHFGTPHAYVRAGDLIDRGGVSAQPSDPDIPMFHIAVAASASLHAGGLWTESLWLTDSTPDHADPRDRPRLDRARARMGLHRQSAQICLTAKEARLVLPPSQTPNLDIALSA